MLSYLILIALALGIHAAPANPEHHTHQDVHLKRLRHRSHEHTDAAQIQKGKPMHERESDAAKVVYATALHSGSESRPEWVRKRF